MASVTGINIGASRVALALATFEWCFVCATGIGANHVAVALVTAMISHESTGLLKDSLLPGYWRVLLEGQVMQQTALDMAII